MLLNNKVYDFLKKVVQVYLPAAATLYFSVSQIWGLPNAERVVGTITAVTVFLGLVLGISSVAYKKSDAKYDGVIKVDETEDKTTYSLGLNDDPALLASKSVATFKIENKA